MERKFGIIIYENPYQMYPIIIEYPFTFKEVWSIISKYINEPNVAKQLMKFIADQLFIYFAKTTLEDGYIQITFNYDFKDEISRCPDEQCKREYWNITKEINVIRACSFKCQTFYDGKFIPKQDLRLKDVKELERYYMEKVEGNA